MPRRHNNLFPAIASFRALHEAAERAIRGKRGKPGAAAFMANREKELLRMERRLNAGSWRSGGYTVLEVTQPKPRSVSAAPFRDRVVHHALCAVVAPIWERSFIADSYANRTGFGTHRAVARYEQYRNRYRHVLRADIFRYFPSIDHEILKADFRRSIACEQTLALMDAIVDGSNPQEPVDLLFAGDDLLTPGQRKRGLPIGNLTSQWFANLYLDGFDHFVKEVLRAPYLRYVDDFALFHDEPAVLTNWRDRISRYLAGRRLVLHPRKTFIASTAADADFLGYVLCQNGLRRLPEGNVRRFRNRLRGLRDRWRSGTVETEEIVQRVSSWLAHAQHANTWRLRHAIFRGGWFDPLWEPDGPPVVSASCVVARGTTTPRTPVPQTATGTTRRTATTTTVSVSPVRLQFAGAAVFTDAAGALASIHGPS